ncbi:hypothetical protein ES288_D02G189000v1, partial [Gossypium darwinii]
FSYPLLGWAVRVGERKSLILKTSILKSKESEEGKLSAVLECDSNSTPFKILRKVTLWRAHYCLSLASTVESVEDLRDSGLPCGGCQLFEFAYLQLVNLAEIK